MLKISALETSYSAHFTYLLTQLIEPNYLKYPSATQFRKKLTTLLKNKPAWLQLVSLMVGSAYLCVTYPPQVQCVI